MAFPGTVAVTSSTTDYAYVRTGTVYPTNIQRRFSRLMVNESEQNPAPSMHICIIKSLLSTTLPMWQQKESVNHA